MQPLLGFVKVDDRTQAQHDAHADAVQGMVRFSLPPIQLGKGEAIRLFDFWKDSAVVADIGFTFNRFHQLTGSCVGAGGGNGLFSTIAAQRVAADAPTKAFIPFWLEAYAMSRHYMGDDGQGDGSMGSTFAKALTTDGIRDWTSGANGMPTFTDSDGILVSSGGIETQWSSYRNSALAGVVTVSRAHLLGSAAEVTDVAGIRSMIGNGYGVTFACDRYIGNASVQSGGGVAYVAGHWDGNGGHQQSIHAYWEHPNDGPLYWAQNNWPGSTYPADPAGGPVCGCWVTEANVAAAIRLNAEVYGLSHLSWFPAQPGVLNYRF